MGNYNPHTPIIMGQEWVPIRDAAYEPDQITESGYTFQLSAATAIVSGAFWVESPPSKIVNYVAETINIYPVGVEDQTGPIRRVVIPVSNALVTGNGESLISSGAAAWTNPSDNVTQSLTTLVGLPAIGLNFAVEQYAQELQGKRILSVRFLYTAGTDLDGALDFIEFAIAAAVDGGTGSDHFNDYQSFAEGPAAITSVGALALITDIKYVDLGNVNINLTGTISSSGDPSALALPWRYDELLLFSTVTPLSSRRVVMIHPSGFIIVDDLDGTVDFGYGALEVFYCEETRVRVGGRFTALNVGLPGRGTINEGVNLVPLKDLSFATPTALAAGEYLLTLGHHEVKPTFIARGAPRLRRLRQLYELLSHRGAVIDTRVIEGQQFTSESTDEIVTITLHTATAIVTGVHAYGTSVGAPVYAGHAPIQEVLNLSSSSVTVTQVRFYARRFGDTTVPLTFSTTGGGSVVSISVADFDALPEIVDGWREVNLTLPSGGSTQTAGATSTWQWTSALETAGNQWQVLAASSPADLRDSVPTVAQTGPATYTPPSGSTIELTWQSPPISGTATDSTTDAVLLFSQEPPAVTGFTVSATSQAVTGVGQFCGTDPRCVPTAILGNRLSWATFGGCDNFNRVNTDTWDTSSSGLLWTTSGGTATNFYVDGRGNMLLPTGDTASRNALLPTTFGDVDQFVTISTSLVATGAGLNGQSRFRAVDGSNYYVMSAAFNTSATVSVAIFRVLAGVSTNISGSVVIGSYQADTKIYAYIQLRGSSIKAKVWIGDRDLPPVNWTLEAVDTSFPTGQSGVRATQSGGNTNINPVISFEDFSVIDGRLYGGGQLEIQRRDPITDWQTIMLTEHPDCVTSFVDLEARVGQLSEYRMRTLNALDFAGPWVTGSATIPSPGVTISGDGNSLLIMTSNQSPSASLAYTMQFEGEAIEQFIFPEVDTLQLQRMFGRNFLTAFHPLERGGEQFTRVLLVNAAAVALPSLGNFRSLRDLGWADIDYVCVRDELGNRWFANVAVPEGSVRMNRTVYMAEVRVTEVSDTASPIDPVGIS